MFTWEQKPPVAAGEILSMNLYPVHTLINSGGGPEGMQGAGEYYDQLLILTKIRVRNQTDIPLFLQDVSSTIKLPDGSEQVNVTAGDKDMDRVFQAYPSLSYLRGESIHRDITLTPGQSVEGLAIFNFPISQGTMEYAADGQGGGVVYAPEEFGIAAAPAVAAFITHPLTFSRPVRQAQGSPSCDSIRDLHTDAKPWPGG